MAGPNLAPATELKKNWKFIWHLSYDKDFNTGILSNVTNTLSNYANLTSKLSSIFSNVKNLFKTSNNDLLTLENLKSVVLTSYVSQLTKSVKLPDDEIEIDYYKIGTLDYPVPKGKKINNVSVTYYDDNLDTVYNFHKCLLELLNPTSNNSSSYHTTSFYPFSQGSGSKLTFRANYIVYENTLGATDYAAYSAVNLLNTALKSAVSNVISSLNKSAIENTYKIANGVFSLSGYDDITSDLFIGYQSKQIFPNVFPVHISRTEADKGGEGLAEVTVDYQRIPNIYEDETTGLLRKPVSSSNNYGF